MRKTFGLENICIHPKTKSLESVFNVLFCHGQAGNAEQLAAGKYQQQLEITVISLKTTEE